MTRHGMVSRRRPVSATDPHASMVIIAADRVAAGRVPGRQNHADAQRSGLSAFIALLSGCGRATTHISRRSKSP
ncbi:hypothetical protein FHS21_006055 [Phyllobacterium trifolii]|uniref:Uncharacterized protein n=1 Tax=Phyllobacterium trifolii TaxID=300193 RepID=A0A839ULX0_9HYPH|nr:hypothetical protein [Phyllobacterium trifolii]